MDHPFAIGDILVSTWGYSMTIVDFYRVEKITPKAVTIVRIGKRTDSGWSGYAMPDPDRVIDPTPLRRMLGKPFHGEYSIRGYNSTSFARRWNGKPVYFNMMD